MMKISDLIRLDQIPRELQEEAAWVVYRLSGTPVKWDKKPFCVQTGKAGREKGWNKQENLGSFAEARQYIQEHSDCVPGLVMEFTRYFVLDIDNAFEDDDKKTPRETTCWVLSHWPGCLVERSPSRPGGFHIIIRKTADSSKLTNLEHLYPDGVKVEVRVKDGLTVTGYTFCKGAIPEADPRDLMKRYIPAKKSDSQGAANTGKKQSFQRTTKIIREHEGRNDYLAAFAGWLARQGLSQEDIETLVRAESEKWCEPPVTETELKETVFKSIPKFVRKQQEQHGNTAVGLTLTHNRDVIGEKNTFLIEPYIVEHELNLLAGDPGVGKSLIAIDLVRAFGKGDKILGAQHDPMKIFFLSNEDSMSTSKWRLMQAGGSDQEDVWFENIQGGIFTLNQMCFLEERVVELRPDFIVIDSLMGHLGSNMDAYRQNEVQALLLELTRIAETYHVTLLALIHFNKTIMAKIAYRIGGSIGFVAGPRSILGVDFDPDQEKTDSRIMAHVKSSYGRKGSSQVFCVTGGKVTWQGKSDLKADELFGAVKNNEDNSCLKEAEDFLKEILDIFERVRSSTILEAAKALGIKRNTLLRAKARLGVDREFSGGVWYFVRPKGWKTAVQPDLDGYVNGAEKPQAASRDRLSDKEKEAYLKQHFGGWM